MGLYLYRQFADGNEWTISIARSYYGFYAQLTNKPRCLVNPIELHNFLTTFN